VPLGWVPLGWTPPGSSRTPRWRRPAARRRPPGDAIADASLGSAVDVYGHSFGAFCSLGAATRTANVRRLVLYEPPVAAAVNALPRGLLTDGRIPCARQPLGGVLAGDVQVLGEHRCCRGAGREADDAAAAVLLRPRSVEGSHGGGLAGTGRSATPQSTLADFGIENVRS